MSKKSKLVALVFKEEEQVGLLTGQSQGASSVVQTTASGPDRALAVLKVIESKAKEAGVKLEDAVVVFKGHKGKVQIKQTKDVTAGKGAGWGSFWGLLVGLIFGGPLAGLLWGLGIGAIYGAAVDHGIDDKFIKSVAKGLESTSSAVLILIREADYEGAIAYLKTFEGELYEADLSAEAEQAVLKVAEDKNVAKAVEAEFSGE